MRGDSLTMVVSICLILAMGCDHKKAGPQPELTSAPEWGEAAHGLAASLSADREVFSPGQALDVHYRIKNVSDKELTVWNSGFWPNHRVVVTGVQGAEVALTEAGKVVQAAFDPNGPRRKNLAVALLPGVIDDQYPPVDLRLYFQLAPGKYKARCVYHEGPVEVWSNVLSIDVR